MAGEEHAHLRAVPGPAVSAPSTPVSGCETPEPGTLSAELPVPEVPAAAVLVGPGGSGRPARPAFEVHLDVFAGPFDLLLSLISKRQLDVSEVALAAVTDEFIAHLRAMDHLDLDEVTGFLVVAATLLDLKAARLLPSVEEDDEDLALLEARDLLFARLLQYRAYKQVAGWLTDVLAAEAGWVPRPAGLEPELVGLEPELVLGLDAASFAALAARALAPRDPELVAVDHIHAPRVSVPEVMVLIRVALGDGDPREFADLTRDCTALIEVVAYFLALLELYRAGEVDLRQPGTEGPLVVTARDPALGGGRP